MKITIPANTKVLINGVTVAFAEDTEVDLPSAETIDEAAALSHIAELGAVFNHFDEENGVNVVYHNGERVELSPESVAPVAEEQSPSDQLPGLAPADVPVVNLPHVVAGEVGDVTEKVGEDAAAVAQSFTEDVQAAADAESTETDSVIE